MTRAMLGWPPNVAAATAGTHPVRGRFDAASGLLVAFSWPGKAATLWSSGDTS